MAKGRPKKDQIKDSGKCQLCESHIYSQPTLIHLNSLTGKATWHRNCKLDKLLICNTCAEELNTLIDKFIIKKNPSLHKWENIW